MSLLTNFANPVSHLKYRYETNLRNFRCPFLSPNLVFLPLSRITSAHRKPQVRPMTKSQAASVFLEPRVLLIAEVATLLRVSHSTIYRWIAESRAGRSDFPVPISRRKGKSRWLATDIEKYIESQSAGLPVFVSHAKQKKEFRRRQDTANAILARHGIHVD